MSTEYVQPTVETIIPVNLEVSRYRVVEDLVEVWGHVGDYEVMLCLLRSDPRAARLLGQASSAPLPIDQEQRKALYLRILSGDRSAVPELADLYAACGYHVLAESFRKAVHDNKVWNDLKWSARYL